MRNTSNDKLHNKWFPGKIRKKKMHGKVFIRTLCLSILIALDKSGYQENIFLIFQQKKHMLCVLIRSASPRHF